MSPTPRCRRTSHAQVQTGIYHFFLTSNHSWFSLVVDGSPSVQSYKLEAWGSSWIPSSLTSHLQSGTKLCWSDWEIAPWPFHFQNFHLGAAVNVYHHRFAHSPFTNFLPSFLWFIINAVARVFHLKIMNLIVLEVHNPLPKPWSAPKVQNLSDSRKSRYSTLCRSSSVLWASTPSSDT